MKLRNDKKSERQKSAQERLENWQNLTIDEQLKELRNRPGASDKQRHKLLRLALGTQDVEVKPLLNRVIKLDPDSLDSGEVMAGGSRKGIPPELEVRETHDRLNKRAKDLK